MSVIKGGGSNLSRNVGQVKRGATQTDKGKSDQKTFNPKEAQAKLDRIEEENLLKLKMRIEAAIDANPTLRQFKRQLLIDITTEGLRIQIVDEQNRPMFNLASAELLPYTRVILREIGKELNGVPNRISLSGHTDSTPYAQGDRGYSNWELSADRANASRRELIAGGMEDSKILRVVGLASSIPFVKEDPSNPINRRISIIVMNKRTENAILQEKESGVSVDELKAAVDAAKGSIGSEAASAPLARELAAGNPGAASPSDPK